MKALIMLGVILVLLELLIMIITTELHVMHPRRRRRRRLRTAAPATRAPRAPARRAARRRTSRPVALKGARGARLPRYTIPQRRHLLLLVIALLGTRDQTAGRARRAARRRISRPMARKGARGARRTRDTRPPGRHLLLRVLAIRATQDQTAGRARRAHQGRIRVGLEMQAAPSAPQARILRRQQLLQSARA